MKGTGTAKWIARVSRREKSKMVCLWVRERVSEAIIWFVIQMCEYEGFYIYSIPFKMANQMGIHKLAILDKIVRKAQKARMQT